MIKIDESENAKTVVLSITIGYRAAIEQVECLKSKLLSVSVWISNFESFQDCYVGDS